MVLFCDAQYPLAGLLYSSSLYIFEVELRAILQTSRGILYTINTFSNSLNDPSSFIWIAFW